MIIEAGDWIHDGEECYKVETVITTIEGKKMIKIVAWCSVDDLSQMMSPNAQIIKSQDAHRVLDVKAHPLSEVGG